MKNNKNFLGLIYKFILISVLFLPVFSFGQTTGTTPGPSTQGTTPSGSKISINIDNPVAAGNIQELIDLLVNKILLPIGGVVAFMMILYSGFLFVISGSSKDGITKAKNAFYSAIIGSAIVLGSWAIGNAIKVTITQLTS